LRRAGVPEDVAALVDSLSDDAAAVTLVNLNQLQPKSIVIQAGGYGEHEFSSAAANGRTVSIGGPHLSVRLAPGAGGRISFKMRRYVNAPTMRFPW
ncbi:MAG TPA: hypothetical protein VKU82_09535, partial [Planctomycetaceae bacterium]|nr:hypothetical protein [Planctomycetaceae bacterium]